MTFYDFYVQNGVPVECCLLDWQILRYASPVCDLSNYIFGGTTKELRDKHYSQFLDVYYKSLTDLLQTWVFCTKTFGGEFYLTFFFKFRLGSDPEKVFPRAAFDDQLKKFAKFGLAMSMMSLPVITNKEAVDMDEMSERSLQGEDSAGNDEASPPNELYVSRMRGVFQDMYDFGYI